ncbi:gamma-1-syntrophin [Agrilus planipennis]|uniref:Gamma-1-syntrophin n=1 Tax=Agrilus planipennis TaxID=224129 RepID=A0A1W4X3S4_AGRPL|nr:gamma-1-syntrophin [Agrilus planipennis]XP_018326976.1 gamma-1-syntrophin [Agrilus planipennis]
MKINTLRMSTPIEEKVDHKLKVRTGMVTVSDGKSRPVPVQLHLSMEILRLRKEEIVPSEPKPINGKERMVQIRRQRVGGLGLSIKGGAEHKLPILISKIYKDRAAHQTGELFVGDAIIKVNGEYITACPHDDAVNILRNAGDIVVLTVKHYPAATPFLQKQEEKERKENQNPDSNMDDKENSEESLKIANTNSSSSRPSSLYSECELDTNVQTRWVDLITLPLMMAYVTRYIFGTDKLRPNAFEVRGLNGISTGIIHCDDSAVLSQWLKYITDNIIGLTHLQMKLYNRNFSITDRIEYMGWVNEGVVNNNHPWQNYKPKFFALKGADLMLFDTPPLNVMDWSKCIETYKVYQTMFRVVKESENVDERQHCFLVQTSGQESKYLNVETRQELLRIENAWHCSVCKAVMTLGSKTFTVNYNGKTSGLTLDWNTGFSLHEADAKSPAWQYKFSQLRGSSDDGKSKLKLHFQDAETRVIETKELDCTILQSLLFCMHAFLTAKVASVDPTFLSMVP